MLYFFPASWTLNGIGTKANEMLSRLDKEFIAGAKMYPKTGGVVSNAVELKVNAARRTAAAIGKMGEEDLFTFTAAADGTLRGRHPRPDRCGDEALRTEQRNGADCRR